VDIDHIAAPVQGELEEFELAFTDRLQSTVPLAAQVITYISRRKGKRLRPLLVFLSAKLHGELTEKTMTSSIIIEMLHTATLIHDDVVDESELRRGVPTINNVWNNKVSVLIGDFLFSRTLTNMVDLRDFNALAVLTQAAENITEGELLQIANKNSIEIDEITYFDLIFKKTASLFSAASQLGVLSTAHSEQNRRSMMSFGENLGMAFQIRDDMLDYTGNKNTLGKPTGNDIRENKITLPLIFALSNASQSDRKSIYDILERDIKRTEDIDDIIDFVRAHDGDKASFKIAEKYAQEALKYLADYQDSSIKECLIHLVKFAINREK
jgi:octaprenyl-diphosphate synthase